MNNSYILSVVIPSKNKLIYLSETIQSLIKEPSLIKLNYVYQTIVAAMKPKFIAKNWLTLLLMSSI